MMIQRKRPSAGRTSRPSKRQRSSGGGYRGRTPASTYQPRAPQGEWKYLDVSLNGSVDSTGAYLLLNGLVPGTGATQRVGMKITIKSLELRGYWGVTPATGVDQIARYAIVLDKQPNGATPAVGNHLLANNVLSPRSLTQRKRYKTLLDKTRAFNATAEPGSFAPFYYYMKLSRPLVVDYNSGTAGTVADISSNALYLYTVSTQAAGVTASLIYGYCRIRYTDM